MVLALISLISLPSATAATAAGADSQLGAVRRVDVSTNWAGYVAAQGVYFTGVEAILGVPLPGYARQPIGVLGAWVGIGGASTDDLIQAGISQVVTGDQVQYFAWYELLPGGSQPIDMAINPGDQVRVTITAVHSEDRRVYRASATDDLWQITIQNGAQLFQTVLPYTSCHCSADWIVEMPMLANGQLAPLALFDLASMQGAEALANGKATTLAELSPTLVILTDTNGQALATPSAIGPQGAEFRVLSVVGSE